MLADTLPWCLLGSQTVSMKRLSFVTLVEIVYLGKSADKAVANVKKIASLIVGMDATDQPAVDAKVIELDGTEMDARRILARTQFWV